jgi:hypothetical protein
MMWGELKWFDPEREQSAAKIEADDGLPKAVVFAS